MVYSEKRTRRRRRQLKLQTLESRQLLAGDIGERHNVELPEDVNADGQVSSLDALMIVNRLGRGDRGPDDVVAFRDVNGDGNVTTLDALRVINRMGRRGEPLSARPERPPEPQPDPLPGEGTEVQPGEFRSIDGTGNNLLDPLLGSAGSEFRRLVDPDYADGFSEPSGEDRPSAREISNILAAQEESVPSERGLSDIVWQWGQFLDHDLDLTLEGEDESFNIAVPTGDPLFDPFATGVQEIHLTRSAAAERTGVDAPRQQVNGITAFIDGSMVYGSDEETAEALRSFEGGRLLTSEGDLLPIGEDGFFLAGDIRANEQNGLTAMHTLWVREHNRIADEIAAANPEANDELVYQLAREQVIAQIQAITYNEYLPTLLGRGAIERYEGYDPTVDPTISNLFATAAFRYGHTSLSSELLRLDNDGNVIPEGNLALRDAFFNPSGILELGIEPLLKGLYTNVSQEIDTQLVDDVRNFLFGPPGAGGFDLASLNIQRGRDHGLPDYNSVREQLGLERAETFADISSDPEVQEKLAAAYDSVDEIDVWIGALAEDRVPGASVGELTRTVLAEQFTALRDGDRFWYQNIFDGQELREIESTRLSDVIARNTDLTTIQENAFIVPGFEDGRGDRPDDKPRRDDGGKGDRERRDRGDRPDDRPLDPPPEVPLDNGPVDNGPLGPGNGPDDGPPPPPPTPQPLPANGAPVDQQRPTRSQRRGMRDGSPADPGQPDGNGGGLDPMVVDQLLADIGRP